MRVPLVAKVSRRFRAAKMPSREFSSAHTPLRPSGVGSVADQEGLVQNLPGHGKAQIAVRSGLGILRRNGRRGRAAVAVGAADEAELERIDVMRLLVLQTAFEHIADKAVGQDGGGIGFREKWPAELSKVDHFEVAQLILVFQAPDAGRKSGTPSRLDLEEFHQRLHLGLDVGPVSLSGSKNMAPPLMFGLCGIDTASQRGWGVVRYILLQGLQHRFRRGERPAVLAPAPATAGGRLDVADRQVHDVVVAEDDVAVEVVPATAIGRTGCTAGAVLVGEAGRLIVRALAHPWLAVYS